MTILICENWQMTGLSDNGGFQFWNICTIKDFRLINRISVKLVNIRAMSIYRIADIRCGFV